MDRLGANLQKELDFRIEAKNAARFAKCMSKNPNVAVPKPVRHREPAAWRRQHLELSLEVADIPVSWVYDREAVGPAQQCKLGDPSLLLPEAPDSGLSVRVDLEADLLCQLLDPGVCAAAFAPLLLPAKLMLQALER